MTNYSEINIDYNHVLDNLQDYMLTEKNIHSFSIDAKSAGNFLLPNGTSCMKESAIQIDYDNSKMKAKEPDTIILKTPPTLFYPQEKDQLFWCFYIIKNGFSGYEYPGNTSFVNEKKEKFMYIDLLRKNKDLLKTRKIKNIKEHVEDELANKETISVKTFIALCLITNINVLYIHKRKCYDLCVNPDSPTHIVQCFDKPVLTYAYEIDATDEKIEHYRNTYFTWTSIDKPIKAASAYNVEELIELCKRVVNNTDNLNLKKKNKKELYELVLVQI